MICGIILIALFLLVYYLSNGQAIYDESKGCISSAKEYLGYRNTCSNSLKYIFPITIISAILYLFIPTTNEALLIYGVGGTIDYLQENPTAQKLPDKCIKALDKWVDSWSIEEKDSVE
jgi:hypothetical protein